VSCSRCVGKERAHPYHEQPKADQRREVLSRSTREPEPSRHRKRLNLPKQLLCPFPGFRDLNKVVHILIVRMPDRNLGKNCVEKQYDQYLNLLSIHALTVELPTATGVRPVNEVSLRVGAGECVGLVGESRSGKTMLSLRLMGLLPAGAENHGEIWLKAERR
jgi:ABC-type multidrug transport system fused ATPase/permease subunit